MNPTDTLYEQLPDYLAAHGVEAGMALLAEKLREQERFHELFDVRLLEARWRLGLPIILAGSLEKLPEPLRDQLEEAYLAACREAGEQLLAVERLHDAWRYYRVLGEKAPVAAALEKLEPAGDDLEPLLELALQEAVAPRTGFKWLLSHWGTCNSISMFDAQMQHFSPEDQADVAGLMVTHLHTELLRNVRADITQREGAEPPEVSLAELIATRPELFAGDNYHIDTSHLTSVIRFARRVENRDELRLALDLARYGAQLSPVLQLASEPPFEQTFSSHALLFAALLGEETEMAVAYFREAAEKADLELDGTTPAEVYVGLLARLGREAEAMDALARLLPPNVRPQGVAPSLLELAATSGEFARLMKLCRERDDLVGFTAGLLATTAPPEK